MWKKTKITFKGLAKKDDVKEGTLKSQRSREQWTRNKDATITENRVKLKFVDKLKTIGMLAKYTDLLSDNH